jgi:hypothetical protein
VWIPKSLGVAIIVVALTGLSMALAVSALGAKGNDNGQGQPNGPLLRVALAPSKPAPTDPMIHGVNPGGVPWVLKRGDVRLKRDGTFRLRLQGLVIPIPPFNNTAGPVTTVSASLYCAPDSDTTAAATTDTVPISQSGDARINTTVSVPSTCLAPVVLVHPNGALAMYIALTGFRP